MTSASFSEMRVAASKYATVVERKSGRRCAGGKRLHPSRLALEGSSSATAHEREAGTPTSRPCFQSRRCFVYSSSYQPRALPPSRFISRLVGAGKAKKSRICTSNRERKLSSSPWFTTWKKPQPWHARAISSTSCRGGSPCKAGAKSMTGTSPRGTVLLENVRCHALLPLGKVSRRMPGVACQPDGSPLRWVSFQF
eukprot:scaffold7282_cov113-Isochrysis_galbana.AAC.9